MESATVTLGHGHADEHHGPPAANRSSRIDPQVLGILAADPRNWVPIAWAPVAVASRASEPRKETSFAFGLDFATAQP